MASSVRIDGSLPDPEDDAAAGLVFAGAWGVRYDFAANAVVPDSQPQRLAALGFPPPFDRDLEGAVRGRGRYRPYLYLFKDGRYLTLDAASMAVAGPTDGADTAAAWKLPPDWTSFDAVLPGCGKKKEFCYFFRANEYIRYDWSAVAPSPGYPRRIGPHWHLPAPFDAHVDGVIAGQGAAYGKRGYVFTRQASEVNRDGAVPGPDDERFRIVAPAYARYDFDDEAYSGHEDQARQVTALWVGLLPLLDAGPAIDTSLRWCDAALAALANPSAAAVSTALGHHFRSPAPGAAALAAIAGHMQQVRNRIATLPHDFRWRSGMDVAARTSAGRFTEIGDAFSNGAGPNGRAAVMVHEAVHFIVTNPVLVDVPEWSGETVAGREWGVSDPIPGVAVSGIPYRDLTTAQAIDNPGSYAAFAQEMSFTPTQPGAADTRFGGARPHE